ncbi:MAG: hypothetical protein VXX36_12295 [Verrucomicrobiota bacterium]|nr:hypothetical protein [Verrucomicrobiota bacterium]
MDIFGYMVLIGALLALTAWMLYARFAARSRENSLQHGPDEASVNDYTEPITEDEVESSVIGEEQVLAVEEVEDIDSVGTRPVGAEIVAVEETPEKKREGEYLDELQEAAAGLAVLMRSSPVSRRATPVVFATEEESKKVDLTDAATDAATDAEGTLSTSVMVSEPPAPKSGEGADESNDGELAPPAEGIEVEDISEEIEVAVPRSDIRVLLGDKVGDQFERIDSGLKALEELVLSIESGMTAFDGLGEEQSANYDGESDVGAAA